MLVVGDVGYTAVELGALSQSQREILADLTAFGSIVAAAELERLGEPWIERERQVLLLQRLAAEVSAREAGFDDDALRAAYASDPEYELVVRHLVILSERWRADEHRAQARQKAEAALRRILAGEDFAVVAGEASEEPGAAGRGGLLNPGREGTWVREFWEAASALDVGGVSGVVETEYGFHVIKLEERRPIPFEEVRNQVLDRLVDLAAAVGRAEAWADREARAVELSPEAVATWRQGASDTIALATWPGGAYRGAQLRRYLLTLEADDLARLEAATDDAYAQVVRTVARNTYLAERAQVMGITLSVDESALVARKWVAEAESWATILGFAAGMDAKEVKAVALRALADTRQRALIARNEVVNLSRALRALRPVTFPGEAAPVEVSAMRSPPEAATL